MFESLTNKILAPHRRHEAEREAAALQWEQQRLAQDKPLDHQGMASPVPVATTTPVTPTTPVVAPLAKDGPRETVVKEAIVDERVRVDTIVEVQPVVHKEIDQTIVHHVEQHVTEPAPAYAGGTRQLPPIIIEHVHTRIIDEVTPIIHREVAVSKVEKVEEHRSERVVSPTVHTFDVKTGNTFDQGAIIKPAIVDEKIRVDTVTEVQPIIHKEVEQNVVHHVEEHIVEPAAPFMGGTVRKQEIVDEQVRKNEIEEITPIVHREIAVPRVEKVEEHVQQTIVAPTQHTHSTTTVNGVASEVMKPEVLKETISAPAAAPTSTLSSSPSSSSSGGLHGLKGKVQSKLAEKKMEREEKKMGGQAL